MKNIVFSDIDGTLIVKMDDDTAKKNSEKEELIKISKTKNGCSYMTNKNNQFMKQLDEEMEFVLVTSRGQESYECIDWGFTPKHILIEGGSILLTNGKKDLNWDNDVKKIMGTDFKLLQLLREQVCNLGYSMKYENNEYLLDFLDIDFKNNKDDEQKKAKFEDTKNKLCENPIVKEKFNIYSHSNGMMIVHKKLEKGEMIKKYIKQFADKEKITTISAGDSKTDSTMFDITDYSFGPLNSGATYEYEFDGSSESKLGFTTFILEGINKIQEKIHTDIEKML